MTFTINEKDLMLHLCEYGLTPAPFTAAHKAAANNLIVKGVLRRDRPEFTNRGIMHVIVDLEIKFSIIRKIFPNNVPGKDDKDLEITQKAFNGNQEWIDIYYYYKYRQYIEWDLFQPNNEARQMNNEELKRFQLKMMEKLIEDGRIPTDLILKMYGIPEGLIKAFGLNKESMKYVFEQIRRFM